MVSSDGVSHMYRLKSASRELHHTYAVNWTTTLLTLGMALMLQVFGIAARHEYQQGGFTRSAFESFQELMLFGQAVLLAFWLALCLLAYLGPKEDDQR